MSHMTTGMPKRLQVILRDPISGDTARGSIAAHVNCRMGAASARGWRGARTLGDMGKKLEAVRAATGTISLGGYRVNACRN